MIQTYRLHGPATTRVSLLLFLLWLMLSLAALGFVFILGTNLPFADEWEFVPALLGEEPLGSWLWTQHNEHRLPFPRLVYYGLFQLAHDFRAGMYLQIVALSTLSLVLMRCAAHARGHADWPDAFFPISLLNLGHWENFIMGYQICFVMFTILAMGLVLLALRTTRKNAFRMGILSSTLLLMIAMTGGAGLIMVLPVFTWLAYLVVLVFRQGKPLQALVLLSVAGLSVLYLALYFQGYERPPGHPPPSRDLIAITEAGSVIIGLSLGVGFSGIWWSVFLLTVVLMVATLQLVLRLSTALQPAYLGALAVMAGIWGLALAIGIGRADWGAETLKLWSRYSLLAWPLLGAIYLIWVKAGRSSVPKLLCIVSALAFPTNTVTGLINAATIRTTLAQFESGIGAGLDSAVLTAQYLQGSGQEQRALKGLPLLRAAEVGAFQKGKGP